MLVLRSIFFALLLPGSATVLVPYFILSRRGVPHWDAIALLLILDAPLPAQMPRTLSANDQRARDIFEQLININTTGSSGSTTVAANAMAKRLTDAGFPAADVQVIGPAASKNYNLVTRF